MNKSLVFAFKDHSEVRNSAELVFTQALVGSYAAGMNPQNFFYFFSKILLLSEHLTFLSPAVFSPLIMYCIIHNIFSVCQTRWT